jgi:hypothetical protein
MAQNEEIQHDLLLIITTAVFILFATGIAAPISTEPPIVIP